MVYKTLFSLLQLFKYQQTLALRCNANPTLDPINLVLCLNQTILILFSSLAYNLGLMIFPNPALEFGNKHHYILLMSIFQLRAPSASHVGTYKNR